MSSEIQQTAADTGTETETGTVPPIQDEAHESQQHLSTSVTAAGTEPLSVPAAAAAGDHLAPPSITVSIPSSPSPSPASPGSSSASASSAAGQAEYNLLLTPIPSGSASATSHHVPVMPVPDQILVDAYGIPVK